MDNRCSQSCKNGFYHATIIQYFYHLTTSLFTFNFQNLDAIMPAYDPKGAHEIRLKTIILARTQDSTIQRTMQITKFQRFFTIVSQ